MTKKEIVKQISEELGLTQLKTKEIVQKTFDAIVDTLVRERRIELRNFGVFEVKERAERKARNPRTGERVDVPAKFVVTFKPGKEMEERVRRLTPGSTSGEPEPESTPAAAPAASTPPPAAAPSSVPSPSPSSSPSVSPSPQPPQPAHASHYGTGTDG